MALTLINQRVPPSLISTSVREPLCQVGTCGQPGRWIFINRNCNQICSMVFSVARKRRHAWFKVRQVALLLCVCWYEKQWVRWFPGSLLKALLSSSMYSVITVGVCDVQVPVCVAANAGLLEMAGWWVWIEKAAYWLRFIRDAHQLMCVVIHWCA